MPWRPPCPMAHTCSTVFTPVSMTPTKLKYLTVSESSQSKVQSVQRTELPMKYNITINYMYDRVPSMIRILFYHSSITVPISPPSNMTSVDRVRDSRDTTRMKYVPTTYHWWVVRLVSSVQCPVHRRGTGGVNKEGMLVGWLVIGR